MYLLTIKDGLVTRFIGPYPTPKEASEDLGRVLEKFSEKVNWQIHALEVPFEIKNKSSLRNVSQFHQAAA